MGGIHWLVGLDGLIVVVDVEEDNKGARAWSVNHRLGYLDFAWTIGREADGKKIMGPKNVVDHLPGAVLGTIARMQLFEIDGPWIVMATLTGIRDYRIIVGDGYWVGPARQDPAYLGEIVNDFMGEDALQPFIDRFWRLFGVEDPPEPQR